MRWDVIQSFKAQLEKGMSINALSLADETAMVAKELGLLTAKPELFALNVDEELNGKNRAQLTADLAAKLQVQPSQIVIISAKIESELATLSSEDQKLYLQDLGLEKVAYSVWPKSHIVR